MCNQDHSIARIAAVLLNGILSGWRVFPSIATPGNRLDQLTLATLLSIYHCVPLGFPSFCFMRHTVKCRYYVLPSQRSRSVDLKFWVSDQGSKA